MHALGSRATWPSGSAILLPSDTKGAAASMLQCFAYRYISSQLGFASRRQRDVVIVVECLGVIGALKQNKTAWPYFWKPEVALAWRSQAVARRWKTLEGGGRRKETKRENPWRGKPHIKLGVSGQSQPIDFFFVLNWTVSTHFLAPTGIITRWKMPLQWPPKVRILPFPGPCQCPAALLGCCCGPKKKIMFPHRFVRPAASVVARGLGLDLWEGDNTLVRKPHWTGSLDGMDCT